MTTPEPLWSDDAKPVLWDDERIATLAQYAAVNWDAADIGDLLRRVRDDYEADRAAHLVAPIEVREAIGYMASTYWLAHAGPNKTYELVMAWLKSQEDEATP